MRYFILIISIFLGLEIEAQNINYSNSEWQNFTTHIEKSTIIGLGEVSHGYENINNTKSIFLDFLIKKQDFKNVIFESSFVECIISFLSNDSFENRLNSFIYPFWNTSSVKKVIKPISNNEKIENIPRILGCDIQEDCRFLKMTEYLNKENLIIDNRNKLLQCDSILSQYIGSKHRKKEALNSNEFSILKLNYNSIIQELLSRKNITALRKMLLLQCFQNRLWLCEYLTISNITKRMKFRDSLMAVNVIWLSDEIIKNEKIIIWAASLHIAKKKNRDTKSEWMGEFLTTKFRNDYFTISIQKGTSPTSKFLENDFKIKYQSDNEKFNALIYLTTLEKIKSTEWITKCD